MAAKGTNKYDYGKNGGRDVYGVDAPDFRESKEFAVYVDTVKAIIYATEGITSRAIKAELGDLNHDTWTAEALDMLCASEHAAMVGVLLVRYVRSSPSKRKVEVIDSKKLDEWKRYERERYSIHPTYQFQ